MCHPSRQLSSAEIQNEELAGNLKKEWRLKSVYPTFILLSLYTPNQHCFHGMRTGKNLGFKDPRDYANSPLGARKW